MHTAWPQRRVRIPAGVFITFRPLAYPIQSEDTKSTRSRTKVSLMTGRQVSYTVLGFPSVGSSSDSRVSQHVQSGRGGLGCATPRLIPVCCEWRNCRVSPTASCTPPSRCGKASYSQVLSLSFGISQLPHALTMPRSGNRFYFTPPRLQQYFVYIPSHCRFCPPR